MSKGTRGVVYLLSGTSCAERLAVSLYTLRQQTDIPVTIMVTGDDDLEVAETIARDDDSAIDVQQFTPAVCQHKRHRAYVQKTLVPAHTPYEHTLFLDADTAVVGSFEEFFAYDWCVTSYSDWQTKGRKIAGRCGWWRDRVKGKHIQIDEMVDRCLADEVVVTESGDGKVAWRLAGDGEHVTTQGYPALNTGVFSFKKGCPLGDRWHKMTLAGEGTHMTDEIAMQLLYPFATECEVGVLDDRFNHSFIHGRHPEDVRVWHFHGQKHLKRKEGRQLWEPFFQQAFNADFGGLKSWAGQHDKWVRGILNGEDPSQIR